MTKQLMLFLAILFLVSGSLHAQSASRLKVDIPFDFIIGSTEFNAGTYSIKPMGVGGDAVLFRSTDSKEVMVVPVWTRAIDRVEHDSELVFQVTGGRYCLWQIWTEGYSEGAEFYVQATEAQHAGTAYSYLVAVKASLILTEP